MPEITKIGTVSRNVSSAADINMSWNKSSGMFAVIGTFGSAQIKLQHKLADSWVDIGEDVTFTNDGQALFTTGATELKVDLSAAPTNVDIIVTPVADNKAF
jgi:hypothetical protein|tara:strand:- start:87 stop:389 length:303 start_codon:yes stop_codon:yes gene_type:complete